jgi:uncharacterized membrane protein
MLASLYVSIVILVAALLFEAVGRLEPNRRLAVVLNCAILAAGGGVIAKHIALRASPLAMGYGPIDFPHNLRSTSARSEAS